MALKKLRTLTTAAATETPATPKIKKVTVVPPPTAETKATPKAAKTDAKAAKTPKVKKASRNRSVDQFLGHNMGIAEFQDYTLSINGTKKLTDEELCAVWQKQFPEAVTFTPHHVKGVRRDYNNGRHSKQFNQKRTGDAVSIGYVKTGDKRTAATPEPAVKGKAKTAAA